MKIGKKFIDRVMSKGSVDTKKYRYRINERGGYAEIIRLPLCQLDTTAAFDGWEVVAIVR